MPVIRKTVYNLLSGLPERSSDVVERRFGLKSGEQETLESIGQSYDISRERVRQIEAVALTNLIHQAAKYAEFLEFVKVARNIILKSSGARRTQDLLPYVVREIDGDSLTDDKKLQQAVHLVLHLFPEKIWHHRQDDEWHNFWSLDKQSANDAKKVVFKFITKAKQRPMSKDEVYAFLSQELEDLRPHHDYLAFLKISKLVGVNPFQEIGYIDHPYISPKATRDRAYLFLAKKGQPMHFVDLAKNLNELAENAEGEFWTKKVTHQTAHNELIKDPRFVLIGRGIYALSDWGYKVGTVKDVILSILKNAPKPLSKNEVIRKVLEQRKVKLATILINLQNKKAFNRTPEGYYSLVSR